MQPEDKTMAPPAENSGEQQTVNSAQSPEDAGSSLAGTKPSLTAKVKSLVQDFVDYAKNTDL